MQDIRSHRARPNAGTHAAAKHCPLAERNFHFALAGDPRSPRAGLRAATCRRKRFLKKQFLK